MTEDYRPADKRFKAVVDKFFSRQKAITGEKGKKFMKHEPAVRLPPLEAGVPERDPRFGSAPVHEVPVAGTLYEEVEDSDGRVRLSPTPVIVWTDPCG